MVRRRVYLGLPAFIIAAVQIFLMEFFILFLFRCLFYFLCKPHGIEVEGGQLAMAFVRGMEFDMVTSTYLLFLPLAFLIFDSLTKGRFGALTRVAFIISFLVFVVFALCSSADIPYYKQFGTHLSKRAFMWNESPGFVLRLIFGNISYYGFLIFFIALSFTLYRILKKVFVKYSDRLRENEQPWWMVAAYIVLFSPFVLLGARGRLSAKSTTHEGRAIVGDQLFVNQVALNPNYTMFRSLLFKKERKYEIPSDIDIAKREAERFLNGKFNDTAGVLRPVISKEEKQYNVVIICMESATAYKMGINGRKVLMPSLKELSQKSLFFDRFFSSGIHTFNGVFSTSAGYPSIYAEQGLRRYIRKPFQTLGNLLTKRGYETMFFSTHDPHFDNMAGFMMQNGYHKVYSSYDLPEEKDISVTGVPDHVLYDLAIEKMNSQGGKPFHAFIMTGSDHGPWTIPEDISFVPDGETEQERSAQYADWAIHQFIEKASRQSWFNNTLFVITGDHGSIFDGTYEMPLSYHHVPLILYMPSVIQPAENHHLGYQPDIVATIAGILGLQYTNTTFGSDIRTTEHPFVFFTADDKLGCVSQDGYFFYHLMTERTKRLRYYMNLDQADKLAEMPQKADSLERSARLMLEAAEFLIRKNYYRD